MGLEVKFNPAFLEATLHQIGERAVKHMATQMERTAVRIRNLARSYAPVKSELLQDSIDYTKIPGRGTIRASFVVYIDVDRARRSGSGTLADYAWIMEESLHPFGRGLVNGRYLKVSKMSAAKGPKVGGKFLARAVKQGVNGASALEVACGVAVRRGLGQGRLSGVDGTRPDYSTEG